MKWNSLVWDKVNKIQVNETRNDMLLQDNAELRRNALRGRLGKNMK